MLPGCFQYHFFTVFLAYQEAFHGILNVSKPSITSTLKEFLGQVSRTSGMLLVSLGSSVFKNHQPKKCDFYMWVSLKSVVVNYCMHVQLQQQKWGECADGPSGLESVHGSPLLPSWAHGPAIGRLTFYFLAETISMLFHGKFLDLNLSQVILVKCL